MDPTFDSVNLTIWSATELSVGILIASLPPLRKQFDKLFKLIVPSTAVVSRSKTPGNTMPLYNFGTSKGFSKPMGRSGNHDDASSERHILPEDSGITKTVEVVHEVTMPRSAHAKEPKTSVESYHNRKEFV